MCVCEKDMSDSPGLPRNKMLRIQADLDLFLLSMLFFKYVGIGVV